MQLIFNLIFINILDESNHLINKEVNRVHIVVDHLFFSRNESNYEIEKMTMTVLPRATRCLIKVNSKKKKQTNKKHRKNDYSFTM